MQNATCAIRSILNLANTLYQMMDNSKPASYDAFSGAICTPDLSDWDKAAWELAKTLNPGETEEAWCDEYNDLLSIIYTIIMSK